jgi:hypothetical protein
MEALGDDAVHCDFIFSKLATPNLKTAAQWWEDDEDNDPTYLPEGLSHLTLMSDGGYDWDFNGDVIALFAAFTQEGGDQGMAPTESGAPFAVFRRSPSGVEVERVGEMWRPWLDGVMPEWEED